ncbi:MAG TPA: hypothetical protein VLX44_06855 [Xanthobacteraceae bacterium]|nr:hypothetical protein [Xanthobacteraceae bacterium]
MPTVSSAAPDPWGRHFDLLESYPALMGGGRRKPALPIGGPAVTWHLGFWIPTELLNRNHERWILEIERFIRKLYHHLESLGRADDGFRPCTHSLQTNAGGRQLYLLNNIYPADHQHVGPIASIEGQATRYQTFRLRFFYAAVPVSVSLELNDEYFTLSTTIDLGWPIQPGRAQRVSLQDLSAIQALKRAVKRFNGVATLRYVNVRAEQSEGTKHEDRDAFAESYVQIYQTIWDTFYDRIFKGPYQDVKKLGGIFADVRGFVAAAGEKSFISGPGGHVKKPSAAQRIGNAVFTDADAVRRVDVLLPWLKADAGFSSSNLDKESDRSEPVEFTFTQIAGKRAIFASALGAQLSRQRGQQAPMTYMALARNQARWQLGRIVHHVHVLISLRLAALYDLQHLIKAGLDLRKLDQELENWKSGPDQTVPPGRRQRDIREIAAELATIGLQPDNANETPQIAGGLAHRAERSRYYRVQSDYFAEEMRDSRIEGFPSYTAAVRRRLGGIYELIDMIGGRFARLQGRVASINRELVASRLLELQHQIQGETRTIEKLQEGAELSFFLFLFPYYFGSVLIHLADKMEIAERFSDIDKTFGIDKTILIATFLGGIALALYKPLTRELRPRRRNAVALLLIVLVLSATLLASYTTREQTPTDSPHAEHRAVLPWWADGAVLPYAQARPPTPWSGPTGHPHPRARPHHRRRRHR